MSFAIGVNCFFLVGIIFFDFQKVRNFRLSFEYMTGTAQGEGLGLHFYEKNNKLFRGPRTSTYASDAREISGILRKRSGECVSCWKTDEEHHSSHGRTRDA